MFSGIVQATGRIASWQRAGDQARLSVESELFEQIAPGLGDSFAVSGVCLSVVECRGSVTSFDIASETRRVTTLGEKGPGELVNLEPSLCLGERLHGHFVQGHVDAISSVLERQEEGGNTVRFRCELPQTCRGLIVPKGAVAIDGVSLTVGEIGDDMFSFYVIPHTLQHSSFRRLEVGAHVNIETDCLARYVRSLLQSADRQAC